MKKIALKTKEELNIYMSPTRQQLLRQLNISNTPMTPKMLADRLKISVSGVQHHIKKLMSLGLIELDHTELINGITASFYRPAQVVVQVGLGQEDSLAPQREALLQDSIAQVFEGYQTQLKRRIESKKEIDPDSMQKWGDIITGVVHLSEKESDELIKMVTEYIDQHANPKADSSAWEYAIIAYKTEEHL